MPRTEFQRSFHINTFFLDSTIHKIPQFPQYSVLDYIGSQVSARRQPRLPERPALGAGPRSLLKPHL